MPLAERYFRWGFPVDAPIGGSCALLLVMRAEHWPMAEALLTLHHADAGCSERKSGDGPLHIAAQVGEARPAYAARPSLRLTSLVACRLARMR